MTIQQDEMRKTAEPYFLESENEIRERNRHHTFVFIAICAGIAIFLALLANARPISRDSQHPTPSQNIVYPVKGPVFMDKHPAGAVGDNGAADSQGTYSGEASVHH